MSTQPPQCPQGYMFNNKLNVCGAQAICTGLDFSFNSTSRLCENESGFKTLAVCPIVRDNTFTQPQFNNMGICTTTNASLFSTTSAPNN